MGRFSDGLHRTAVNIRGDTRFFLVGWSMQADVIFDFILFHAVFSFDHLLVLLKHMFVALREFLHSSSGILSSFNHQR